MQPCNQVQFFTPHASFDSFFFCFPNPKWKKKHCIVQVDIIFFIDDILPITLTIYVFKNMPWIVCLNLLSSVVNGSRIRQEGGSYKRFGFTRFLYVLFSQRFVYLLWYKDIHNEMGNFTCFPFRDRAEHRELADNGLLQHLVLKSSHHYRYR